MSHITVDPERLLGSRAQLGAARDGLDRARTLLAVGGADVEAWMPSGPLARAWRDLLDSLSEALARNLDDLQTMADLLGASHGNYQAVEAAASRVARA